MAFPRMQVRTHNGAPALFINGEPTFPFLLMTGPRVLSQLQKLAPLPTHLHTDVFPLGWQGVGQHEYTAFDVHAHEFLSNDKNALLLPRIHLDPPEDWMKSYPEELVGYADTRAWDGETCWGGPYHPSFASQRWVEDAGDALRNLIRHAAQQEYSRHIIGWHIGSGVYGEWHAWNGVYYPDTSTRFAEAYGRWLQKKYPGQNVEPRLPTVQDRMESECGVFRDPTARRWMLDHAEFFHELGARVLGEFARIVKEETDHRSFVVAFNGYLPELGVNHEIDHRAFDLALRDPNIDAFASPHSYARRKPGESGLMRGFMASVSTQGKLWLDEADDRTHLAHPTQWKHVETREEAIELLWRAFAHTLTHGVGLWMMDQGGLWFEEISGSWYADPQILQAFAQMNAIGQASMQRSRTRQSEVAVVMNFKNAFHLADRASGMDNISSTLTIAQTERLAQCGAPFDFYLLSELFEPNVPDYKAYIFLDAFYLSDEEIAQIESLKAVGKTLLVFYAAGFVSQNELSLERMRRLLEMPVEQHTSIELPDGSTQSPGFFVPGLQEGLAQSGNLFFCPAPPLESAGLRRVLRHAGAHIYCESDDTIMIGGGYFAIHASEEGVKSLRWPQPATWKNVRTGEIVARDCDAVKMEMRRGQTLIFSLL